MNLSVIIPTLNESARIAETISRVRACGDCEIVITDGGSDDGTVDLAGDADICLTASCGRASQQNAGAEAASGDVLFFLHADCWPEPGAFRKIEAALEDEEVIGGCFAQCIESGGVMYRWLEAGNAWRVHRTKWIYGDQGLFVRRRVFERVGGFPVVELMEDLYLAKKLKPEGRLKLIDHPLHVSARRWEKMGVVRQTIRNWMFLGLTHCGVPPSALARRYVDVR